MMRFLETRIPAPFVAIAIAVGMWDAQGRDEPAAWGILLADVVRHLANAIEAEKGVEAEGIIADIVEALGEELDNPTSKTHGEFRPRHS